MRTLVALLLGLLYACAAHAQPAQCVDSTSSWTMPYQQGNTQAVTYYLDLQMLSGMTRPGRIANLSVYPGVPLSVAQRFQSLTNPDSYYQTNIQNRFSQCLLAETGCPIQSENSAPNQCLVNGRPMGCVNQINALLAEGGCEIITEDGARWLVRE